MLQKLRGNSEGFTLIELMIVIAIIGILAAIAIPNFIAYRNKAFCSAAESDANNIAAAIADYFAVPTRTNPLDPDPTVARPNGLGMPRIEDIPASTIVAYTISRGGGINALTSRIFLLEL